MDVEVEVEVDSSLSELLSPSVPPPPGAGTADPLLDPGSIFSSSSLGGGAGKSGSAPSANWPSPPPAVPLTEAFLLPGSPPPVLPREVVVVVVAEEMV